MFFLKLLIALLQAPAKRIAELLGAQEQPFPPSPPAQRSEPVPAPLRARPRRRRPQRRTPVPPPPSPRAKEVDEEPVLTAEFAEEGAEDGAGAQVHIDEPWAGYAQMRVPEIQDRVAHGTQAELAAVQLYEVAHRNRKTIIDAVTASMRR